jgi:MOSC domain-containing protein
LAGTRRELKIGTTRLRVTEPRCKMINVDPDRAVADVNIPRAMVKALGHALCGVYAEVVAAGRVALGDTVELA